MSYADELFLVSCVGKKRKSAAPAKSLYESTWFLLARAHVEARSAPWFSMG